MLFRLAWQPRISIIVHNIDIVSKQVDENFLKNLDFCIKLIINNESIKIFPSHSAV